MAILPSFEAMGHPLTREKLVLFVLTVLFSPLAVAAVILRTVVVRKVHKYNQPWGIDDWLLYVALCFLVGLCITASFSRKSKCLSHCL